MASNLLKIGAPERSRTPNPQIRSLVLYPVELRALMPCRGRRMGRQQLLQPTSQGKSNGQGRSGWLTGAVDLLRWGGRGGSAREKHDGRHGDDDGGAGRLGGS